MILIIFEEITKFKKLRIGSGELSDSLLYDPYTNYSNLIIDKLEEKDSIIFEFKTKTTYCDPFFNRKPIQNIVIGFSMNPKNISSKFEKLSSLPEDRLKMAKDLCNYGWKVSFHFDPVILTREDNPENYFELFDQITQIPSKSIAWFSLGTLRYHPDMINNLRNDESGKKLLNFENITGLDGKVRYFIEERLKIYKKIVEIYNKKNLTFPLYFCMESDKIYYKTFGKLPNEIDNLNDIFTI